ncbi:MAG TPA: hypothetical protein VGM33_07285 [Baekduia sp.]
MPVAVRRVGVDALDVEALAQAAGMDASAVDAHLAGDVLGLLGAAYLASARALEAGCDAAYRAAPTPREGVERSIRWLLRTLADDPDRGLFAFVELARGPAALVALREQIRRSSVGLWMVQHAGNHPASPLPRSHFEMINNATITLVADHVRQGTTDRLPDQFATVMTLFECGVPEPPRLAVVGA